MIASSHNVSVIFQLKCYRNDSILLLNQKVNNSVVNQTRIIHYKSACLARVLKCCKNDQILESCYQQQENVLRQKKYECEQVNIT